MPLVAPQGSVNLDVDLALAARRPGSESPRSLPEAHRPITSDRKSLPNHKVEGVVAEAVERTFTFVELAGFTALTEAHGDTDAVALLDRFLALARESLTPADQLVKSIGDAVMLASTIPSAAVESIVRIWDRFSEECGMPVPRAGMHLGSSISRDGDYLGAAVNLAARVADRAYGGHVLCTAGVADAASALGLVASQLGAQRLRNLAEPVNLVQIHIGGTRPSRVIDPVCRMSIDPESAAGTLRYDTAQFWFCLMKCVASFSANPTRYLTSPGRRP